MKGEESPGINLLASSDPPGLPKHTVLYRQISTEDYSQADALALGVFLALQVCPGCQNLHGWGRHAKYLKYHGDSLVQILRFRCRTCRRTHALIPSFSIPHTSLDTGETQAYLHQRHLGKSRRVAALAGSLHKRSHAFLRSLERRFSGAVIRAKAVFAGWGEEHAQGYGWVESACAGHDRGLEFLNHGIIQLGGCSFFGGNLKDRPCYRSAGRPPSHENTAYGSAKVPLDSG